MTDKLAIITGGSRGIGKSCSIALSRKGYRIAIIYAENDRAAKETLHMLEGDDHFNFRCDVSDFNQVKEFFEYLDKSRLKPDVLVNSAGIALTHYPEMDEENWIKNWNRTIAVNLSGMAHMCYFASKCMKKLGRGRIINISSRGAFRGVPEMLAYGASKGGLNSFTQSLAVALAPHGIFAAAVAPGFVDTEMASDIIDSEKEPDIAKQSPFNRIANPDEVAELVSYLATQAPEFMSGGILDINGASYLRT